MFGANDPVTREQLAALLWRYVGSPSAEVSEDFADEARIAYYAQTAVDWARANGIINGRNDENTIFTAGTAKLQCAPACFVIPIFICQRF